MKGEITLIKNNLWIEKWGKASLVLLIGDNSFIKYERGDYSNKK